MRAILVCVTLLAVGCGTDFHDACSTGHGGACCLPVGQLVDGTVEGQRCSTPGLACALAAGPVCLCAAMTGTWKCSAVPDLEAPIFIDFDLGGLPADFAEIPDGGEFSDGSEPD